MCVCVCVCVDLQHVAMNEMATIVYPHLHVQELQEISVEDRRQKLENSSMELQTADTAIDTNKVRLEGMYLCSIPYLGI